MAIKDRELKYKNSEILFTCCDGDPSEYPESNLPVQDSYPSQRWVKGTFNKSEEAGFNWGVVTTAYGIILKGETVKMPYDVHIDEFEYNEKALRKFNDRVENFLKNHKFKIVVIFSGGCQLNKYVERVVHVANPIGVDVLGFGKPCQKDSKSIKLLLDMLQEGATEEELMSILDHPECFQFRESTFSKVSERIDLIRHASHSIKSEGDYF